MSMSISIVETHYEQWQCQGQFFLIFHTNFNDNINFFLSAKSMAIAMSIFLEIAVNGKINVNILDVAYQCQFQWQYFQKPQFN